MGQKVTTQVTDKYKQDLAKWRLIMLLRTLLFKEPHIKST